jgi:hypothetical protein
VASLIYLTDDALPEALFARLSRRVRALGHERIRRTYQTPFWWPAGAPPSNVVEEAVAALGVPGRFAGVEWWLSRMRTSNVQVDFHQDRDEQLFLRTGRLVHPRWSSLLFLNRCRGGLLAVTREAPNEANPAKAPDVIDFALAAPRPNRFVRFEGRLTHGVLDSENQVPGARRPREPQLRLAIAINFWSRRPQGIPTFGESSHYRGLALAARNEPSR